MKLTPVIAGRFARAVLGHVTREFPHHFDHVAAGPAGLGNPRELHPVFFGSGDWASCAAGWWSLLTLARLFAGMPEAETIRDLAIATFTDDKVAAELAWLDRPEAAGFARPYGWAWLLTLHAEAMRHHQPWARALDPLAATVAVRFAEWLPRASYPVRSGGPANTAFAAMLAHAWAAQHDPSLARRIVARVREWYLPDRAAVPWEPDGDALVSPLLTEAHCLQRLLPREEFEPWFDALLPDLEAGHPAMLLEPIEAGDRSDPMIARLDGLNLSRAWSWRALGKHLPLSHVVHLAAERHLAASLPQVTAGTAAEPWLASFALLALLPDSP